MTLSTLFSASLAAALLAAGPAPAARPDRGSAATLHVQDMVFDPLAGPPPFRPSLRAARESGYSLVQYAPGAGQKVADSIRAAGGAIHGPVVQDALLVGGLRLARLKGLPGVRFAGAYHPGYKLSPSLRARLRPAQRLNLAVRVFRDADGTARAIAALGGKTGKVRTGFGEEVLTVSIPARLLERLAALPEVRHVEPAMMALPALDVAPVTAGVRANQAPPWTNFLGLDGSGQILGLYDSGADNGDTATLIPDLRDRVTGDVSGWSNRWQDAGWQDRVYDGKPFFHGTSVTDIAIGNGSGSDGGVLTGVAPRATAIMRSMIADADGGVPGYLNLSLALANAYDAGARVHNDSWDPATGAWPNVVPVIDVYSAQGSAALDQFAQQNPDMLIVTSGGNKGPNASTMGTLSCSKNSLAVGNAGNGRPPSGTPFLPDGGVPPRYASGTPLDAIAQSSSRGPAPTGRLKPDVSAPGAMVAAACSQATILAGTCPMAPYRGEPAFGYGSGTSRAAPVVSGTALLVRQFFANEGVTPSGMLLKAVLVNGTRPLFNFAPDSSQGWGEINLQRSLTGTADAGTLAWYDSYHAPGARFAFVTTGQSVDFDGVEFTPGQPLAITLTWYDYADGTLTGALVNDLELTLANGAVTYAGGVPSMDAGVTQPNGPADTLNNTEKIVLATAPGGAWTITVRASRIVPDSPQYFALAVMSFERQAGATDLVRSRRLAPRSPGNEARGARDAG